MPFVVENGAKPDLYRSWNDDVGGFAWTHVLDDAIHYSRRKDAELVHAQDEDACFIREIDELGVIPSGPWRAEIIDGGWRIVEYQAHVAQRMLDVDPLGLELTESEIFCRICVTALNRAMPILRYMRARHEELIARLLSGDYDHEIVVQGPDTVELVMHTAQAEDVTTLKLLHLFQEFAISNATQWKLGANDHHHPLYGMVAEAIHNAGMRPITEGPEWAFIQPLNRTSLEDLRKKVEHGNQETKNG